MGVREGWSGNMWRVSLEHLPIFNPLWVSILHEKKLRQDFDARKDLRDGVMSIRDGSVNA